MGRRGPKPTPTAILEARASWRATERKKGEEGGEPEPHRARPYCPRWLTREAKAVWHRLVDQLDEMGVLAVTDVDVLARYCATFVQWKKAQRFVDKNGATQTKYAMDKKTGGAFALGDEIRPEMTLVLKLGPQLDRLDAKLGLSPADRVGLKTVKPKKKKAPVGAPGFTFGQAQ